MPVKRTVNAGHDRLTRIADRALAFIEADPNLKRGERIIVLVSDDSDQAQGVGLSGYVPPKGEDLAVVDLGRASRALMRTGQPQLVTAKGNLPPGYGGPGWLSGKVPGTRAES